MRWNYWIRQTHRWLSPVFTLVVLINLLQVLHKQYSPRMGYAAVFFLMLLLLTGLCLFVLPYVAKWRGRSAEGRL